jgi:hypothetical protein
MANVVQQLELPRSVLHHASKFIDCRRPIDIFQMLLHDMTTNQVPVRNMDAVQSRAAGDILDLKMPDARRTAASPIAPCRNGIPIRRFRRHSGLRPANFTTTPLLLVSSSNWNWPES